MKRKIGVSSSFCPSIYMFLKMLNKSQFDASFLGLMKNCYKTQYKMSQFSASYVTRFETLKVCEERFRTNRSIQVYSLLKFTIKFLYGSTPA